MQTFMRLKYRPSSEPLRISAKYIFCGQLWLQALYILSSQLPPVVRTLVWRCWRMLSTRTTQCSQLVLVYRSSSLATLLCRVRQRKVNHHNFQLSCVIVKSILTTFDACLSWVGAAGDVCVNGFGKLFPPQNRRLNVLISSCEK